MSAVNPSLSFGLVMPYCTGHGSGVVSNSHKPLWGGCCPTLSTPCMGREPLFTNAPMLFSSMLERPPAKFPGLTEYCPTELQYSIALSYTRESFCPTSGVAARLTSCIFRPTASTISSNMQHPPASHNRSKNRPTDRLPARPLV